MEITFHCCKAVKPPGKFTTCICKTITASWMNGLLLTTTTLYCFDSIPYKKSKKLQNMCKSNNIPTTKTIPDIEEGWVDKPKGALQLLYERRWIDPTINPKEYTIKGKMDEFGNRNMKMSLKSMILCQPDFMNQQTMLQYYCNKLGVMSDRTPVAH